MRDFWYCVLACLHWKDGQKKRNIWKCEELVTWGRDRKRSSTHYPHCQPATPVQCPRLPNQPGPRPKKTETHTEAKKVLLRGVSPGNSKKQKKNSRLVAEFPPIMTLISSSFQCTSCHWKKLFLIDNLLSWRKTKRGTMAGTTVLCTQYPARVTIDSHTHL